MEEEGISGRKAVYKFLINKLHQDVMQGTYDEKIILEQINENENVVPTSLNRSVPLEIMVYNRVPKCGSETMKFLIEELAKS